MSGITGTPYMPSEPEEERGIVLRADAAEDTEFIPCPRNCGSDKSCPVCHGDGEIEILINGND